MWAELPSRDIKAYFIELLKHFQKDKGRLEKKYRFSVKFEAETMAGKPTIYQGNSKQFYLAAV